MSTDKQDLWKRLAEPVPTDAIEWRQDGRPIQRNSKPYARFVAYISANVVRERLDGVVPGEWDLHLELLPPMPKDENDNTVAFKARLQILGVIREDVGQGKDFKSAATDAFKRAAVRFGIAHELYAYEQNWVQLDDRNRPVIDPGLAYARRSGNGGDLGSSSSSAAPVEREPAPARRQETSATAAPNGEKEPVCPKCQGKLYDNRLTKRNPKAPDYKCRDRSCDGVIWPPRNQSSRPVDTDGPAFEGDPGPDSIPGFDASPLGGEDSIPF